MHALRLLLAAALLACSSERSLRDAGDDRADTLSTDADAGAHADGAHDASTDLARDRGAVDAGPSRCPGGVALPYPEGTVLDVGIPLPDIAFPGLAGTSVRPSRFYAPCAQSPRLLVVRVLGAWSGPSRFAAAHTGRLLALPEASRLDLLDLLVKNDVNQAPTEGDLRTWSTRYDRAPANLALDTAYRTRALFVATGRLPLVALVDTRSMVIVRTLDVPDGADLAFELTATLADLDGRPAPPRPPRVLYDERLLPDAWEMVQAMTPVGTPPRDSTNRWADDPGAARLGRALFFDTGLSATGRVSCASCHDPTRAWADGRPRGIGLQEVNRNTPAVTFAAWQRWQFWDGRADSLWAQALGPIENDREMGGSRLAVAHHVARRYERDYTGVFGALPALGDTARFPAAGMPGTADWERMSATDQTAINRVYANVGKALAAFERTLRMQSTALDGYALGRVNAMTAPQRDGLRRFFEVGCAQCHFGPTLTNDSFHNVRFGTGRLDGAADRGRLDGVTALRDNLFRADGEFSDNRAAREHLLGLAQDPSMLGQFHTPTLRGVSDTGPWGHGGTVGTLDALMLHYADIVRRGPMENAAGELDFHLGAFHMDTGTLASLVAFLGAVTAPLEPLPGL
ncbi:MAG: hypothetical protein HY909_09205 [Deltaproteobacteria bacterium]|nr:hypothetical protein [Deltaproteobacteria bacterium]